MSVFVTKADGSRQLFDRGKVVRTCLRMGASIEVAEEVAERVKRRLYDGMSTAKILQLVFLFMRKRQPRVGCLYDLRRGLSLMVPKPEFERFVQVLLSHNGFVVSSNRVVVGNCGEHEVDAVAMKDGVTYFVEAKHHFNYHALTGLDESRIARAILEDVAEAYEQGKISERFDRAMIVTNTKYSEHAFKYGRCRNILQIGWNTPPGLSLQDMIEAADLYPLSCLKSLRRDVRARLVDAGIVVLKQIVDAELGDLSRRTGVSMEVLEGVKEGAERTVHFCRG